MNTEDIERIKKNKIIVDLMNYIVEEQVKLEGEKDYIEKQLKNQKEVYEWIGKKVIEVASSGMKIQFIDKDIVKKPV